MLIRDEQEGDYNAISMVTTLAFADAEHSDQTEPEIIVRLRAAGVLTISLVAIDSEALVGHVAFSPVTVNGDDDSWFGLGPVSVDPAYQGAGVGSALIRGGLKQLQSLGAAGCAVFGDPAYYARFGFERDDDLRYTGAPPEYFMRLLLGAHVAPSGRVEYALAFTG